MTPQHRPPRRGRSRNERVLRHLPLVRSIVYGLRPRASALDVDDLVSAGTVGLLEAAERYDPRRGVPFASYAYSRVKGAVLDELRRSPELNRSDSGGNGDLSLQAPVPGNQNLTLIEVIPDPLSPEPAAGAEFGEVVEAIRCLPNREREILGLHTAGHAVSEIAERHGCSEARASQILSQARLRLERRVA
jgi:RNA polymerase sigma factor (sigma-70 family)